MEREDVEKAGGCGVDERDSGDEDLRRESGKCQENEGAEGR